MFISCRNDTQVHRSLLPLAVSAAYLDDSRLDVLHRRSRLLELIIHLR